MHRLFNSDSVIPIRRQGFCVPPNLRTSIRVHLYCYLPVTPDRFQVKIEDRGNRPLPVRETVWRAKHERNKNREKQEARRPDLQGRRPGLPASTSRAQLGALEGYGSPEPSAIWPYALRPPPKGASGVHRAG